MSMRLKPWQIAILILPIASIVIFLLVAAGQQIRAWGVNWIWAIFIFALLGWRWLLVRWTRPAFAQAQAVVDAVNAELAEEVETSALSAGAGSSDAQIETVLDELLESAQEDPPIWDDWGLFWQRCASLVTQIAQVYAPDVKRPLLNIYVPEAYGLIRGTVDDTDRMMQKLSPVLSQVSIGQMVEGVELYRRLEPSAKRIIKAFNWAQWIFNPAAAAARQVSAKNMNQANQQILLNLSNLLRETALRNLAQQAAALYGGEAKARLVALPEPALPEEKTQTLQSILEQAQPEDAVAQRPVNLLLVGRTGAGKSSLINTLFQADLAAVDVLPSTDKIQQYQWQGPSGKNGRDELNLWDTPGYEQSFRGDLKETVLDFAAGADGLVLVTPALDPALQMDVDFLEEVRAEIADLPVFVVVTQVDKLRPVREWSPPYQWQTGGWPKETAIREAVNYREEALGSYARAVLPVVCRTAQRESWGDEALAEGLVDAIAPAKQLRMARFLRSREARVTAAAKIIDRYTAQMTTTAGLTKLLKSPVLQFISTMTTGNPALGAVLMDSIPVEEVPIVLGKLQMAYELYSLFEERDSSLAFDLLTLWPVLLKQDDRTAPHRRAWAFGHALVEYWTGQIGKGELEGRIDYYVEVGE